MAKINFNKVEHVLEEGLRQYGIKQLLYLADLANTFGFEAGKESPFDDEETRALTLNNILQNIQILKKKDKDIFKKLNADHKKIKNLVENPTELTPEEWEKVKRIKQKLDDYRRELRSKIDKISDEDIVKSERKKHINKRFNKRDGWLPLH